MKEQHNGYVIEVDEEGEIFLTSAVSLETLWLTELLQYSYKQPEMAFAAAKQWIDNVPPNFLDTLTRGQISRFDHEQEHHNCEEHSDPEVVLKKTEKLS